MTHLSSYRRTFRTLLGILILFCSVRSGAGAQDRNKTSTSFQNGVVKIPVVDKQDIRFTQLSLNGEFFQEGILSIAQDHYGFVWLGTNAGLYRYDGYSLKSYRHDQNDQNTPSDNRIRVVHRDREGILWMGGGNHAGLDRLDPTEDTFKHYRHDPGNVRTLSDNGVACIYQDRNGVLWVGTRAGLNRMDPASGSFIRYYFDRRDAGYQSGNNIVSIFDDRQGNLWVGTRVGLVKLNPATGRFSRFLHDPTNPHSLAHDYVSSIWEDQSGVLWVGATLESGLSALDVKTGEFTHYSFHSVQSDGPALSDMTSLYEDREGVLWLCNRSGGLVKFDRNRKQAWRYGRHPENPNSLHNDAALTLFEDREGIMWVGAQSGLSRFSRKALPFVNYLQNAGSPSQQNDNHIWSVQGDSQGFLWFGTQAGLNRLDRRTGRVTEYRHDLRNRHSIPKGIALAIREGPTGELWISTSRSGVSRFDRARQRFITYRHDPQDSGSLSSDSVFTMLVDRRGTLWLGTEGGGLNRFDSSTGRFKSYRNEPSNYQSLSNNIKALLEDRTGILWLGTQEGLSSFDPKTEQFTSYRHDPRTSNSLSHDNVTAIREDRQGRLWIGTMLGLNLFDRSRGIFTAFTTVDGLPDNIVEAVQEDSKGYLWLATHNGLSRFDPQTKNFRNYSEADGLPSVYLTPDGVEGSWQSTNGEITFGSINGITTFYPEQVSPDPNIPPVVLTAFHLFNKPVGRGGNSPLHKPIWASDSLKLEHTQSIFTLEFAGLSYAAPEKNRYRFRLEGLEPDWNEVDSRRRQATYTSLPARDYVFRVQASNKDGVWNEKGVSLPITVLPPLWATWWFRSLAGLTIAAAMLAVHKARIRSLRLAGIRLEAQVAERTRELEVAKEAAERANRAKSTFLATMSHELRTPLNAILGFSALVRDHPTVPEEQRKQLEIVNRSGEHLLGLIDDVLDTAKIEAGRMLLDERRIDVIQLVRDTIDMMRARAADKGLELILDSSPMVPRFIRSDAGKLRQVLINLLGNALKFTERGSVAVRLDVQRMDTTTIHDSRRAVLILEVEDTGVGIPPEDQMRIFDVFVQAGNTSTPKGTGLGLSITQKFVQLMGGTICVRSAPGQGSLFSVELPVKLEEESEMTSNSGHGQVVGLAPGQPDYRILIVEDKKENWLLLQRLLLDSGFQVEVAEEGVQGIEMFRTWRPHLIWMDIRLPRMGGVEAARQIRGLEGGREVKIVALSASALTHEREDVLSAGLDDFLHKPYRREEIFDCVARHLGVQYEYRQVQPERPSDAGPALRDGLMTLPGELRKELADAVIRLDSERIKRVIGRVAEHDRRLGEVLSRAAEQLAYTPIFKALDECNTRLRTEAS